ncbi:MAG: hypothetical protein DLM66_08350 [Candidatus Dormiibacter spiritus]|nr:hypothetical protein [Candidatus Dormibacteraeota bacterium]PZR68729.1 MAG: hypothetical protein DLM66_08350 [Candidatus Dormibacteraeota bacterium]
MNEMSKQMLETTELRFTSRSLLLNARLPYQGLQVQSQAVVSDFPGRSSRISRLQVTPTIVGAEDSRRDEYLSTASRPRQHCFIGRHLSPEVSHEVGEISLDQD